jgi:2-oxoisovalerate dehydrogenase E1 component
MNEAINDPNPVLFFEHKQCRSVYQDVPKLLLPLGKAAFTERGDSVTIITLEQ